MAVAAGSSSPLVRSPTIAQVLPCPAAARLGARNYCCHWQSESEPHRYPSSRFGTLSAAGRGSAVGPYLCGAMLRDVFTCFGENFFLIPLVHSLTRRGILRFQLDNNRPKSARGRRSFVSRTRQQNLRVLGIFQIFQHGSSFPGRCTAFFLGRTPYFQQARLVVGGRIGESKKSFFRHLSTHSLAWLSAAALLKKHNHLRCIRLCAIFSVVYFFASSFATRGENTVSTRFVNTNVNNLIYKSIDIRLYTALLTTVSLHKFTLHFFMRAVFCGFIFL